jgi:hypothetical protein
MASDAAQYEPLDHGRLLKMDSSRARLTLKKPDWLRLADYTLVNVPEGLLAS